MACHGEIRLARGCAERLLSLSHRGFQEPEGTYDHSCRIVAGVGSPPVGIEANGNHNRGDTPVNSMSGIPLRMWLKTAKVDFNKRHGLINKDILTIVVEIERVA